MTVLQLRLGPLQLTTLPGELKETLGDQVEVVGGAVTAGERRARAFQVTIPIRGDATDTDRYLVGERMRRQVRALIANTQARLQGLYLEFSADPELNGWLLVGGGDLSYGPGGITLADFRLELTDCYQIASMRTHRPARRLIAVDRRLSTTPRDTLGTLYSTKFAGSTAVAAHVLPVAITDATVRSTGAPLAGSTRASADGDLTLTTGLLHGDVIDFEQAETDQNLAHVQILDRQGETDETLWEQVFGADQPLTAGDVPVLSNKVCRVVFDVAASSLNIESWIAGAWGLAATVTYPALSAIRAGLMGWTPERGVLLITGVQATSTRVQLIITLQRGWTGPRIESYTAGSADAELSVFVASSGSATLRNSAFGPTDIEPGTDHGTLESLDPWVLLLGPGSDRAVHLAMVQDTVEFDGAVLAGREGLRVRPLGAYVSVWLGTGPRATGVADATTHGQHGLIDSQTIPELVSRH